jgi:uncharacterized protein
MILSFIALQMISRGAEVPPCGMALSNLSWLIFGFFVLSFAIPVIAVMAGIVGGVVYTPIMLAFTPVNSLIVRATGLIVAMCGGIVSNGLLLKTGMANLKLSIFSTLGYGLGGFIEAQGYLYCQENGIIWRRYYQNRTGRNRHNYLFIIRFQRQENRMAGSKASRPF